MKRILIAIVCLGLAGFVLAFSVWRQTVVAVRAQTGVTEMVEQQKNDVAASEAAQLKETKAYYLVYPGMLPDHPLYFLKMSRDRVRWWLTSDPMIKADLALLLADKRIGAAEALAEGGKMDMAVQTAVKAEHYLREVPEQLKQVDVEQEVEWQQLVAATYKHEDILHLLKERSGGAVQSTLDGLVDHVLWVRGEAGKHIE